jgi:hypothetical protein
MREPPNSNTDEEWALRRQDRPSLVPKKRRESLIGRRRTMVMVA